MQKYHSNSKITKEYLPSQKYFYKSKTKFISQSGVGQKKYAWWMSSTGAFTSLMWIQQDLFEIGHIALCSLKIGAKNKHLPECQVPKTPGVLKSNFVSLLYSIKK